MTVRETQNTDIKKILSNQFDTDDFIKENRSFVEGVIKQTFPSVLDTYEKEDYIQEGSLALYRAMLGYDETKGIKFCTFAYIVIKRDILKIVKVQTNKIKQCSNDVLSLNFSATNYDEYNEELIDTLHGDSDVENEVIRDMYNDYLAERIEVLNNKIKPKYQQVLKYLMEGKNQTEIAKIIGCTNENVRQKIKGIRRIMKNMKIA
jgi:RNA polymerase sigma factor (sigma-70 family)